MATRRATRALRLDETQQKRQQELELVQKRLNAQAPKPADNLDQTLYVDDEFESLLDNVATAKSRRSMGSGARRSSPGTALTSHSTQRNETPNPPSQEFNTSFTSRRASGLYESAPDDDISQSAALHRLSGTFSARTSPSPAARRSIGAAGTGVGRQSLTGQNNSSPSYASAFSRDYPQQAPRTVSNAEKESKSSVTDKLTAVPSEGLNVIIKVLLAVCAVLAVIAAIRYFRGPGVPGLSTGFGSQVGSTADIADVVEKDRLLLHFQPRSATPETFDKHVPGILTKVQEDLNRFTALPEKFKRAYAEGVQVTDEANATLEQSKAVLLSRDASVEKSQFMSKQKTKHEDGDSISLSTRWAVFSEAVTESGKEIAKLEDILAPLRTKVPALTPNLQRMAASIDSNAGAKLKEVLPALSSAFNNYAKSREALAKAEADYSQAQKTIAELEKSLAQNKQEQATLKKKYDEAKTAAMNARSDHMQVEKKIPSCSANLNQLKDAVKQAEVELSDAAKRADDSRSKLIQAEKALQQAAQTLDDLNKRANQAGVSLGESESLWKSIMGDSIDIDSAQDSSAKGSTDAKESAAVAAFRQNLVESIQQNEAEIQEIQRIIAQSDPKENTDDDADVAEARKIASRLYERKLQTAKEKLDRLRNLLQALDARSAASGKVAPKEAKDQPNDELSEILSLRATVQRLRARYQDSVKAVEKAKATVKANESKVTELKKTAAEHAKALEAAKARNASAKQELDKATADARACETDLREQARALKVIVDKSYQTLETLNSSVRALETDMNKLEEDIRNRKQMSVAAVESARAAAARVLEDLRKKTADVLAADREVYDQVRTGEANLSSAMESISDVKKAVADARKQLDLTKTKLSALRVLLDG